MKHVIAAAGLAVLLFGQAWAQQDPPPAASPPPILPPEKATRKITVFRSVKSEQYDVPEEVQ